MANFYAIQTVCDGVIRLLQESYRPDLIEPQLNLEFEVYRTDNFKTPMNGGVSLFLYRVFLNGNQRTASNGTGPHSNRRDLPLDLHFFITVWAQRASLQHALLGWAMRTLEDVPLLPASLLNGVRPDTFRDHESVEIVHGQLTNEEMMRIWDDLSADYQLSVPYVARVVRIDPTLEEEHPAVGTREFGYGVLR